jgi:glutathione reductase (NADPH)
MNMYDLLVVGTGSAGTAAALECAHAGWRVAVVDERPFGGTCLLRGCDPKKMFVGAADLADWARRMNQAGVTQAPVQLDWPGMMRFKRVFTDPASAQREREFDEAGVAKFHGTAHFTSAQTLRINDEEVSARYVLIAAGNKPLKLGVPGEELLQTSDDFLSFESLPERIVFVGGGFIAFEFAHIAARFGARTHIVEREKRPLRGFDADLVERVVALTRENGIEVHLETEVSAFERHGGEVAIHVKQGGKERTIACGAAIHGGGRVPNIDELALDAAGVERTKKGVKVNVFLQSVSNPNVYAAGDAADGGGLPLTPVAGMEGELAAHNMLHGNTKPTDFTGLVSAVYTIPALASVGLTEEAAREQRRDFEVRSGDMSGWYTLRRVAEKHGAYKVLIEKNTGDILGAHVLGPQAEEIVNLFSLAMRGAVPAQTLKDALFGYPTGASDIAYMV